MPRLETLHVAALPYPTSQGTQAAIGCMLDALARQGRTAALLTYASGAGREVRFEHRVTSGRMQPRSLRSGPSIEKLVADVALARTLRRQARDADVVIAHHVEAAAIAHALRLPRWIFVAHTTLGPELPTYLPPAIAPIASRAGRALDRWLARVAPGVAAISDHVAREMTSLTGRVPVVLPVPLSPPALREDRARARGRLGIADDEEIVLYAGNLDAYQGLSILEHTMRELRATRPRASLLVATESRPDALRAALDRRGVPTRFAPLATEHDRALAHGAADVAVVTRGTAGGFPIKLLDAIAREVPVVAMRRALSGSAVPGVHVVDDDPLALARGLRTALSASPTDRAATRARATQHLISHHDAASFTDALDTAIRRTHVRSRRS